MINLPGLTQKAISRLSGLNHSTISRWLSKNNVMPIIKSREHEKNLRYSITDVRNLFNDMIFKDIPFNGCKVISFYNFKGGTGKTSICYQVSTHLALMGFNVLVIDGDPQGHLSTSLGFDNNHEFPTLADVVSGFVDLKDTIRPIYEGLDCIPSNLALTRLEVKLNELPKREERIKIILEPIKQKYDFIIFDSNPTISLLNRNILVFSDLLAIVCETQPYSLNGLKLLMEDMNKFYTHMEINRPELFVIPNKYEDRSSSSAEAMTVLRQFYEKFMVPDFAVRRSEDINTAAKTSQPLAFFARSNSIALEDITDLIHALLMILNEHIKFIKVVS